jgi:hypothetical protein
MVERKCEAEETEWERNKESGAKPKKPNGKENAEIGAKSKGKERNVEKER